MNDKIGFISGTGPQGKGMALRFAKAGIDVVIGSRTLEKGQKIAQEVNETVGGNHATGADNPTAIRECDILFLTVPFEYAASQIETYLPYLQEKSEGIFVDVTVPLTFEKGFPGVEDIPEKSGIELLRTKVPEQYAMIGAFKTVSAEALNEIDKPLEMDTFVFGDNKEARAKIMEICNKIPNLRAIKSGRLSVGRFVEPNTAFLIYLNRIHKVKDSGFRLRSSRFPSD